VQTPGHASSRARRLERIVAELFQFMRPVRATGDAGNVAEAIRAAVEIAAGRLRGKSLVQVDLGELPPVRGSTLQLMHVFLNLVVNATQNIHDVTKANTASR
jgi:C4-dicarboxylate-specific signal transduction histidine kinase